MNFSRMAHECTGALHARLQCMLVFLSSWLPHAAHSARSDSPSAMPLSANPSGKEPQAAAQRREMQHLGRLQKGKPRPSAVIPPLKCALD